MPTSTVGRTHSPPRLTDQETQWLIKHARESARVLVQSVRGSPQHATVRWDPAGTYKRVQMYKGEPLRHTTHSTHGRPPDKRIHLLCGRTTLHGTTIEEVADYFDISTTPKLKAFAATQDDVQDGVVLYTLVAPGPESGYLHQVTIKWISVRMPAGIAKPRDFLTLECQDSFTDTTGRRGWVRSFHSIKMPTCPDRQGFVRGSMYHSGYVFVETETRGVLACTSSLQVDLKGSLVVPRALYDVGVKRRLSALAHLQDKLDVRRLDGHGRLLLSDLDPTSTSDPVCSLCTVGLGVFTRKTECRACGAIVCHACTESVAIVLPAERAGTPTNVRLCVACASRRGRRGTVSGDNDIKRQRAVQLSTREASYHTDGSLQLRRPISNHRNRRSRRSSTITTMSTRGRDPPPMYAVEPLIASTLSWTGERRRSPTVHNQRVEPAHVHLEEHPQPRTIPDVPLVDHTGEPSRPTELESISFCDSLDGFHSVVRPVSRPPPPPQSETRDEDPTASAVELYRGILALQRAHRMALSASTRERLAGELAALYAKLKDAIQHYEVHHSQ